MTDCQLPSDGSVLIIDDNIEEALPLIKLLSKNGIASTYYTGIRDADLPAQPAQKIRLAFLDIQLIPGLSKSNYATNIKKLLHQIIPDENGPYILIIWSGLSEVYADELEDQVTSPEFAKRPVIHLRFKKADYFEHVSDNSLQEQLDEAYSTLAGRFIKDDLAVIERVINSSIPAQSQYKAKSDALQFISRDLQDKLKGVDSFHLFTIWENLVNKAAGKTVASFSKLYQTDEYWTDNLKSGVYRMAYARLGKTIDSVDEDELIRNALKTLNHSFLDTLENEISETTSLSGIVKVDKNFVVFTKKLDGCEYKIKWPVNKDR
jgi:hypothetical protein